MSFRKMGSSRMQGDEASGIHLFNTYRRGAFASSAPTVARLKLKGNPNSQAPKKSRAESSEKRINKLIE